MVLQHYQAYPGIPHRSTTTIVVQVDQEALCCCPALAVATIMIGDTKADNYPLGESSVIQKPRAFLCGLAGIFYCDSNPRINQSAVSPQKELLLDLLAQSETTFSNSGIPGISLRRPVLNSAGIPGFWDCAPHTVGLRDDLGSWGREDTGIIKVSQHVTVLHRIEYFNILSSALLHSL